MSDIFDIFQNHTGRYIYKLPSYFPVYQRHLGHLVGKRFTFIEIGCGEGGSLQMWRSFFGPDATIVGLDIRQECMAFEDIANGTHVRIGSQSDIGFLARVLKEFGPPDVLLDDGSHVSHDQFVTFNAIYYEMPIDGIYLVEDLHCNYLPQFGGFLGDPRSFIARTKDLIDRLNGVWHAGPKTTDDFTLSTRSMHFYDSIVVFERGHLENPQSSWRRPANKS